MTPDEMKALIAEAREVLAQWNRDRDWMPRSPLGMIERLVDALEAATSPMPNERLDEIEERAKCPFAVQAVRIGEHEACARALVEHDVPALVAEVRRLRAAHPAEETDSRAAAWQEGWERGFRDMQAAKRDEDGYMVVKPTRNPYRPVPEGSPN